MNSSNRFHDLKVFGTFRSGTNLIRALLQLNYHVRVHNNTLAYKHVPVPASFMEGKFQPFPYRIVGTVKDPFAFIVSAFEFCRWNSFLHVDAGEQFDEFVRSRFVVFDGNFDGFPRFRFPNPVQYWNSVNYTLLSLPDKISYVVKYETLLSDMENEVSALARHFSLTRKSTRFLEPSRITKNLGDQAVDTPEEYTTEEKFKRKKYYLDREYMARFSESQIAFISSELDEDVVDELRYPQSGTISPSS